MQALGELSQQAAEELAEGSVAVSRVAELEARVAELEGQGCRLEAGKAEAEQALRKGKRGKDSSLDLPDSFSYS